MLTMFDLTIPALNRGLSVMRGYIDAAAAHVSQTPQSDMELVGARLAPDMMNLAGQVQRVSDNAKNGVSRLTGWSAPSFPDNEQSLAQLRVRLANTIDALGQLRREDFDAAETRVVELNFASASGKMDGQTYLTNFLLPNFYFHIATAHAILRSRGLNIGKRDYLGAWA